MTPAVAATPAALPTAVTGKQITVKTDVIELQIDTLGGDIVGSKMLAYPESLGSKQPYVLMTDDEKTRYIAQSGLLGAEGPDTSSQQALYTADQSAYELQNGQNELVVKLHWQNKPGSDAVDVTKTYTFTRGSYDVKVGYEVENHTAQPGAATSIHS